MKYAETKIPPRFQLANLQSATKSSKRDEIRRGGVRIENWRGLKLMDGVIRGLEEGLRIKKPNEVQKVFIPRLLEEKSKNPRFKSSFLCAAQTGSGKTLGYLIPLIQILKEEEGNMIKGLESVEERIELLSKIRRNGSPRGIILLPTHELVNQVFRVAKLMSHYCKLRVEKIDTWDKGFDEIVKKPIDIGICTPKQLINAMPRINLKWVRVMVVDEADTLMAVDFGEEVKRIYESINDGPNEGLKLFVAVSATIPNALERSLEKIFPEGMEMMTVRGLHTPVETIRQRFQRINLPGDAKFKACLQLLRDNVTSRFLIFCNSVNRAEKLHKYLCESMVNETEVRRKANDLVGEAKGSKQVNDPVERIKSSKQANNPKDLIVAPPKTHLLSNPVNESHLVLPSLFHGYLPHRQRASIMSKFNVGQVRALICTDLASRGLDTVHVNHVVNFDFPRSCLDYLHRIGRTGRACRGGTVTSFVTGKDVQLCELIQLAVKQNQPLSQILKT